MRQAFGGWAAIDGCFEARDTQKWAAGMVHFLRYHDRRQGQGSVY